MHLGRLARCWEEVVGPVLARETAPRALDEGGLLVAASSAAWGTQVRFLADEIRRRANRELGSDQVRKVRVVVSSRGRDPLRGNDFGRPGGDPGSRGRGASG
jgi:predicted nucleic acid-binding Zn ribbon protein